MKKKRLDTPTFANLAYSILKKQGKPMHYIDITNEVMKKKNSKGKTPFKTVGVEINKDNRFIRVGSGIYGLKEDLEKWKGAVNDLPNSSRFLLSIVCSYGEAVNVLEILEKFKKVFKASQTWSTARERLRERNLIVEKFDEEKEERVIFAPKRICPILLL